MISTSLCVCVCVCVCVFTEEVHRENKELQHLHQKKSWLFSLYKEFVQFKASMNKSYAL